MICFVYHLYYVTYILFETDVRNLRTNRNFPLLIFSVIFYCDLAVEKYFGSIVKTAKTMQ